MRVVLQKMYGVNEAVEVPEKLNFKQYLKHMHDRQAHFYKSLVVEYFQEIQYE